MIHPLVLFATKGALILAATWGAVALLRSAAPALRAALWSVALLVLPITVLPLLGGPSWTPFTGARAPAIEAAPVGEASAEAAWAGGSAVSSPREGVVPANLGASGTASEAAALTAAAGSHAPPSGWSKSYASALPRSPSFDLWIAAWLAGALLLLSRSAWQTRRAAASLLSARRPAPPPLAALAAEAAARLGLRAAPPLFLVDGPTCPCTLGWWRPCVVLPAVAEHFAPARLDAVLLHELEHVRRRDNLVHALARVGAALHWFNPLAWFALRQLARERELAVDEVVVQRDVVAVDYAALLVDCARSLRGLAGVTSMAQPSSIEWRVRRLLAAPPLPPTRLARSLQRGGVAAALLLALAAACAGPRSPDDDPDDPLARIAATRQLARDELRDLHLVVTGQRWDWDAAAGDWKKSEARWHARAWYEGHGAGRFRVDYDPQIVPWHGGARPFSECRYTESWDGTRYRKIDHVWFDGHYQSRVSESREELPKHVPLEGVEAIGGGFDGAELPGDYQFGDESHQLFAPKDFSWTPAMARRAVDIFFGPITVQESDGHVAVKFGHPPHSGYSLDPTRGFATVAADSPIEQWRATGFRRLGEHLWLPTGWERTLRDRYRGSGHERVTVTIDSAGHYAPQDSDAIYSLGDIELGHRTPEPPAGPSFVDLPARE
ncbi:MAG: M56 family metallopeptidase [Planctomycetes bacterium]|nr:M56 family metallopeptidase [Planctomycetota bacterium]